MATLSPLQSTLAPEYDRSALSVGIVHFGIGNFHRSHQAMYLDRLLRSGHSPQWGICCVGFLPVDRQMAADLTTQEGAYTLVLKHADGTLTPSVVGSIVRALYAPDAADELMELLVAPSTRIVSLTVTEGGYNIDDETGQFRSDAPAAVADAHNPTHPASTFGYLVEALRRRRAAGTEPFTVLSCDNLPHNGNVVRTAVVSQARLSDPELAEWIAAHVSFPNCMVDRITPATTPEDAELVQRELGITDLRPVVAEPFEQWVIEDVFPTGRPAYEEAGAQLVADVAPYELMKLRLLNASHQSLAHWGRLLGYTYGHEATLDEDVAALTRSYVNREARPPLPEVPGINLDEYVESLFERFANPAIADTLARLAEDASDRMPKFVLPSVRDNLSHARAVDLGAAMCAAWTVCCEAQLDRESAVLPAMRDRREPDISAAVTALRAGDHDAFLKIQPVFGELATRTEFTEPYLRTLFLLREAMSAADAGDRAQQVRRVMRSLRS